MSCMSKLGKLALGSVVVEPQEPESDEGSTIHLQLSYVKPFVCMKTYLRFEWTLRILAATHWQLVDMSRLFA